MGREVEAAIDGQKRGSSSPVLSRKRKKN